MELNIGDYVIEQPDWKIIIYTLSFSVEDEDLSFGCRLCNSYPP